MKHVLLLDDYSSVSVGIDALSEPITVVTEKELGNPDVYRYTPALLDRLRACQGNEFDLVILGNNQGIGILKAHSLCDDLRVKTIVVSNMGLDPDIDEAYDKLGFTKRMTRSELFWKLSEELGL